MRGTAAAGETGGDDAGGNEVEVGAEVDDGFSAVADTARSCALAVEYSRVACSSIPKMVWRVEDFASKVMKEEERSEDCRTDTKRQSTGPPVRGDKVHG